MSHSNRSCADLQAEREAEALDWFAENLEQPVPVTRLRREGELRDVATELGIDPDPHPRYPRGAAIRRWFHVLECIASSKPIRFRERGFEPTTTAARNHRAAEVRRKRMASLKALLEAGKRRPVPIDRAAQLLGLSKSGTEKAIYRGDLPYRKAGRHTLIRIADLKAFLVKRAA